MAWPLYGHRLLVSSFYAEVELLAGKGCQLNLVGELPAGPAGFHVGGTMDGLELDGTTSNDLSQAYQPIRTSRWGIAWPKGRPKGQIRVAAPSRRTGPRSSWPPTSTRRA